VFKKKCLSVEAGENTSGTKEAEDPGSAAKAPPIRVAAKRPFSRFQLKCYNCDFRVSTPALLENHTRDIHPGQAWYRCKLCDVLAATPEWMEAHLSSDGHARRQEGDPGGDSASFDACVESVDGDSVGDAGLVDEPAGGESAAAASTAPTTAAPTKGNRETRAAPVDEEDSEPETPRRKRGRPKQGSTTTCGYCGLVVSNATNLSVHVRRKHSKEYGYSCTLCNYSCVTKGDMDRHCITKKHVRRAQESAGENRDAGVPAAAGEAQEADAARQSADEEAESDDSAAAANERGGDDEEETRSDGGQKKSKYDPVSACGFCDFVAQSIPSLHLHVKRKHTKDFEYVCLACSYYAVTSREMSRHAVTEKHKLKSQSYLEPPGGEERGELAEADSCSEDGHAAESQNADAATEPAEDNEDNEDNEDAEDAEDAELVKVAEDAELVKVAEDAEDAELVKDAEDAELVKVAEDAELVEDAEDAMNVEPAEDAEDAVAAVASSADEKQVESLSSSSSREPVGLVELCEEAPAELLPAVDQCAQQESPEEEGKPADEEPPSADEELSSDVGHPNAQMSRAPPFDACIVSVKDLAEQERRQRGGPAPEGEAAVVCLTGGVPTPSDSSHVRKIRRKAPKARREAKRSNARIRCEDCGFVADGVSGLNVHISMKHPSKEKHFHCLVCGKSFYTESNLHQHLTSAAHLRNERNSVETLPEGGAGFKCVKCTDRFASEQDLFVHIKEKHEELLREVNKYVLEDTEQINREREDNQGSVCKHCGKVCKSSNSMAFLAHIRTHTGTHAGSGGGSGMVSLVLRRCNLSFIIPENLSPFSEITIGHPRV